MERSSVGRRVFLVTVVHCGHRAPLGRL